MWRWRQPLISVAMAFSCGIGTAVVSPRALADVCERAAFEAVVDQASSTLIALNQQNTPVFQTKLRALKDKRNWTQEQFMREGALFVRDERIATFDTASEQLLLKINTQGGDASDCKTLAALRQTMQTLVTTQNQKWSYMFGKIDLELAK